MHTLYDVNGLPFWDETEIRIRSVMADHFRASLESALVGLNPAWRVVQTEAPLLTPKSLLNPNYTGEDVWEQTTDDFGVSLILRPETTPGSYAVVRHLLRSQSGYRLPLCVWQVGKSFRREQDQPSKHVRLKEFYQQEFQCVYASDTANDYHSAILDPVRKMITEMVKLPTRVVPSDRLPHYSKITMDIEVDTGEKWLEVCSISVRTDFPDTVRIPTRQGIVEKDVLVLEVAIGLDRCVYAFSKYRDSL